jgi:flagellar biosynthesis component FlhA
MTPASPGTGAHAERPAVGVTEAGLRADVEVRADVDPAALGPEVASALATLLAELGLPGHPRVAVRATSGAGPLVGLRVNGRRCHYPPALERQLAPLAAEGGPAAVVAVLCAAAVGLRPGLLLDDAALLAWCAAAGMPCTGAVPTVLRTVVGLGVSIAERSRVRGLLEEAAALAGTGSGPDPQDVAEQVLVALRPAELQIEVAPAYLRALTVEGWPDVATLVPLLRENLLEELGLPLPQLRLRRCDELPTGSFRFRINALPTAPIRGYGPNRRLVLASPAMLRERFGSARRVANPVNGTWATEIDAADAAVLEGEGYRTYRPADQLVMALAAAIRQYAPRLLDQTVVAERLRLLESVQPALVEWCRTTGLPLPRLVRVLRALLAGGISIRNLSLVLHSMLDLDASPRATPADPDALVRAARQALAANIGSALAPGRSTVTVYLLDRSLTALLEEAGSAGPDAAPADVSGGWDTAATATATATEDVVVAALCAELATLSESAHVPVVLTTARAQPALQRILAVTAPTMRAIAPGELPDLLNVQPFARVQPVEAETDAVEPDNGTVEPASGG